MTMRTYTKLRFGEGKDVSPRDFTKIEKMLREAEEEVRSMEFYHNGN